MSSQTFFCLLVGICLVKAHATHTAPAICAADSEISQSDCARRDCEDLKSGGLCDGALTNHQYCGKAAFHSCQSTCSAEIGCTTTCNGYSCPSGWVAKDNQGTILGQGRTNQACCKSCSTAHMWATTAGLCSACSGHAWVDSTCKAPPGTVNTDASYQVMDINTDGCTSGVRITDAALCADAAASLGWRYEGSRWIRAPAGCLGVGQGNVGRVFFNTGNSGPLPSLGPICSTPCSDFTEAACPSSRCVWNGVPSPCRKCDEKSWSSCSDVDRTTCDACSVCVWDTTDCKSTCEGYNCPVFTAPKPNKTTIVGKGRTKSACCFDLMDFRGFWEAGGLSYEVTMNWKTGDEYPIHVTVSDGRTLQGAAYEGGGFSIDGFGYGMLPDINTIIWVDSGTQNWIRGPSTCEEIMTSLACSSHTRCAWSGKSCLAVCPSDVHDRRRVTRGRTCPIGACPGGRRRRNPRRRRSSCFHADCESDEKMQSTCHSTCSEQVGCLLNCTHASDCHAIGNKLYGCDDKSWCTECTTVSTAEACPTKGCIWEGSSCQPADDNKNWTVTNSSFAIALAWQALALMFVATIANFSSNWA